MQAYILINAERGKEQEIYDSIVALEEISGAHLVFGEWDLIAKVRIESSEALGTFILDKVKPLDGVTLTSTLIVAR
ncbi:MAG: Lrp/AsnC family transcriptional regulator [Candidatus Woesearchaeota archaeon]